MIYDNNGLPAAHHHYWYSLRLRVREVGGFVDMS